MKILIGVDTDSTYKAAMRLASRMQFPGAQWSLAHSVESILTLGSYGMASETVHAIEFARLAQVAGKRALEKACAEALESGIAVDSVLLFGNAACELVRYADGEGADLICVHSERKGRLGSLFLGSVSRGLALSARQSVLITKGQVDPSGEVSVVFATDHSDYADRSLSRFIEMSPKGIKNVHVATSIHLNEEGPYFHLEEMKVPIEKEVVEAAGAKLQVDVAKLAHAGYNVTGQIYNLPVDAALRRAMEDSGSQLLVLGAQGHGFLHRLSLGSVALHQVVVESHSILLIRVTESE